MSSRVLHIQLIGGDYDREITLIPHVTLSPSTTGLNFAIKLNRRQFPIQLAYVMTIHKLQGQSLNQMGIDLRKPIFAHGQLYIAFSRTTSPDRIKVLLSSDNQTKKR
jgi:Helicase